MCLINQSLYIEKKKIRKKYAGKADQKGGSETKASKILHVYALSCEWLMLEFFQIKTTTRRFIARRPDYGPVVIVGRLHILRHWLSPLFPDANVVKKQPRVQYSDCIDRKRNHPTVEDIWGKVVIIACVTATSEGSNSLNQTSVRMTSPVHPFESSIVR